MSVINMMTVAFCAVSFWNLLIITVTPRLAPVLTGRQFAVFIGLTDLSVWLSVFSLMAVFA